jgi:hypothetical protein
MSLEAKLAMEMEGAALAKELQALEIRNKELNERAAALRAENTAKRQQVQDAFIERNKERFADLDAGAALIGLGGEHAVKFNGAIFALSVPSGEQQRTVENFAIDPTVSKQKKVDGGTAEEKVDYGPVNQQEVILLQWVAAFTPPILNGQPIPKRDLTKAPLHTRLEMLRSLPAPLIRRLAEECDTLNTYLSIYLERNLGN